MPRRRNKEPSLPLSTCCWKHLRVCCCRYGWVPLIVSIVLSVGAGFSLSSAVGCDFVRVNIGFEPANPGWNSSSTLHAGLWFVDRGSVEEFETFQSMETDPGEPPEPIYSRLQQGFCRQYSEPFEEELIKGDRAWKIARIMGMVAGIGGVASVLMSWLFVFTNLPECTWQALLLPLNMISFVAEGSKFLLYDISLCRNPLWLPSGIDSESQAAESCHLGESARWGLVAASLFLAGLVLVCLQIPRKRKLDDSYGTTRHARLNDVSSSGLVGNSRGASYDPQDEESYDDFTDELPYGSHYSGSHYSEDTPLESSGPHSFTSPEEASYPSTTFQTTPDTSSSAFGSVDDPLQQQQSSASSTSALQAGLRISESRLQALQNMRQNAAAHSQMKSSVVQSFVQDVEMEFGGSAADTATR